MTQPQQACETCAKPVGPDAVLVLTAAGQVVRHPDCHAFGKPMH